MNSRISFEEILNGGSGSLDFLVTLPQLEMMTDALAILPEKQRASLQYDPMRKRLSVYGSKSDIWQLACEYTKLLIASENKQNEKEQ